MQHHAQMTRLVLPGMKARKRGAVVNIGSAAATVAPSGPLYAVYAGTKVSSAAGCRALSQPHKCHFTPQQPQLSLLGMPALSIVDTHTFPDHGRPGEGCTRLLQGDPTACNDVLHILPCPLHPRACELCADCPAFAPSLTVFVASAPPGVCGHVQQEPGSGVQAARHQRAQPGAAHRLIPPLNCFLPSPNVSLLGHAACLRQSP